MPGFDPIRSWDKKHGAVQYLRFCRSRVRIEGGVVLCVINLESPALKRGPNSHASVDPVAAQSLIGSRKRGQGLPSFYWNEYVRATRADVRAFPPIRFDPTIPRSGYLRFTLPDHIQKQAEFPARCG
jgi:hypothetical protein